MASSIVPARVSHSRAPVAVAGVGALVAAHAVLSAADSVGLGPHQRLHERGDHLPKQIRTRLPQLLGQPPGQVDTGYCGHRVAPRLENLGRISLRITRWPSHMSTPRLVGRRSNTTSMDATTDRSTCLNAYYSSRICVLSHRG